MQEGPDLHLHSVQIEEAGIATGAMSAGDVARQLAGWRRWLHSLDPRSQPHRLETSASDRPPSPENESTGDLR